MRVRHLAPAAPLLLLLAACSPSTETGTETDPSLVSQAPEYEVVSEEAAGTETQITVEVQDTPQELAVQALVTDLQEDRTEEGVYALTVLCASSQEQAATAEWAQGEGALEEASLEEGEIAVDVDADVSCEV